MSKNSKSSRFRSLEFCHVEGKKLEISAVPEMMTGHAGAILIRKTEEKVGLVEELSRLVKDDRQKSKVTHTSFDIPMQRVCQIGTGNADGNDCDWGRFDGAIKAALGRDPETGKNGASQETTSVFESKQDDDAIKRLENLFLDNFIKHRKRRYKTRRPKAIWLDIDGTPIETHGAQEGANYRGGKKYGYQMYFPLLVYCGKWLLSVTLRTGTASESKTVVAELEKCVKVLRTKWPSVCIKVRLDAGFGSPELYNWCRKNNVGYLVAYKNTSVMQLYTKATIEEAEQKFKEKFGEPQFIGKDGNEKKQDEHERIRAIKDKKERMAAEHGFNSRRVRVFTELSHKAESWKRWERIIIRVDFTDKGPDVRLVMVSSKQGRPEKIYCDQYCRRGLMEKFIGRLKSIGKRLSAQTFNANQFRLILYGIADQLLVHMQELITSSFQSSEPTTLQRDLLKMPAVFRITKTKIVMEISELHPHCKEFLAACRLLKAA